MNRISYVDKLTAWVNSSRRKPLVLEGARQVGKTWLMQEFAKKHFEHVVYARFDKDKLLRNIFTRDFDLERIVRDLQIRFNTTIDSRNTILLLDEIQSCKDAITALKYFCEERPDLPIIAAGSLLGLEYRDDDQERSSNGDDEETTGFPVGKVNMLEVHPFSFVEFLDAVGQESLAACIRQCDWERIATFGEPLTDLLKHYYVVGGMPEAVDRFAETGDYTLVRHIQDTILMDYLDDMSKYQGNANEIKKTRLTYNNIAVQLSKKNTRFQYKLIKSGARAAEYENAVEWLTMANLVSQIYRAEQIKKPLENYRDIDSFKIYLSDLGLLCAKKDIVPNDILYMVDELDDFKGGMAENYVNTQLVMNGFTTYYWESDRGAEVDFVIQLCGKLIPIEVKSADNVKAKSLKVYIEANKPDYAIKISAKNFGFENNIKTIPLYAAFCISNPE